MPFDEIDGAARVKGGEELVPKSWASPPIVLGALSALVCWAAFGASAKMSVLIGLGVSFGSVVMATIGFVLFVRVWLRSVERQEDSTPVEIDQNTDP